MDCSRDLCLFFGEIKFIESTNSPHIPDPNIILAFRYHNCLKPKADTVKNKGSTVVVYVFDLINNFCDLK